ncbi:MAG TPA: hypothetical protein VHG08_14590 [Longimicrobium sp.]|nr:hypothetical protein [Longimicrobium sp.]
MKKLRLRCEDLRVESFPTAPALEEPGTVRAHEATPTCPHNCLTENGGSICNLTHNCG